MHLSLVQFAIVLLVALGSLSYGYSASIISTTLGQPTFLSYFHLDRASNATQLIGAMNGLFQGGGLIGALSCFCLADNFGRKKALMAAALLTIIGGGLQSGSVHIAMYIVARLITGIAVGALLTLVPLYQSEIAPPQIRGLLVGMHGTMICAGYSLSSWVGFGFYFVDASGAQWRIPLAFQCVLPILLLSGLWLVPESPRWLLNNDRTDEALTCFTATRAESVDQEDTAGIDQEFQLLHSQIVRERRNRALWNDFFRKPSLRKRCLLGFGTMVAAQCTGTLVFANYSALLYHGLGFSVIRQLLMQSIWITCSFVCNGLCALIVDRVGRVRLLTIGLIGCLSSLIGEMTTLAVYEKTGSRAVASGAVFFLFWQLFWYGCCVDANTYIYTSEIFPTHLRARGLGVSISGLFASSIIFVESAPTAFADVGYKYYALFVSLNTIAIFVVYFTFPETKGKRLEDIAAIFGDHITLEDTNMERLHRQFQGEEKEGVAIMEVEN
ncbi:uncharacterized protein PV06_11284 [Exophiala oligosperma]|uniref:Major facilitator superfamily (MFS) profile domain-containing protein n=1 Tax=Exophiala oligosperma TaxID=215243 RepID=A0A0D2DL89_9EURO|nr:uncharacterized protein PV06_11284 [Exophiala oligosperma]KIW36469.1 hypothetical protein PV06_11284 [Exophiala oligosperma]